MAAALKVLLDVWRTSAEPRLAELIIKIGAAVPEKISPDEWARESKLGRPEALSTLLSSIKSTSKVMKERVVLLTTWKPDPRLDRWVVSQYTQPPFTSTGSGPFWTALKKLTVKLTDPVARAELALVRSGRLEGVTVGPPPPTKALSSAELADLAGLEQAVDQRTNPSKGQRTAAELLADVLAKPADLAPRHVLMDALLEVGDPRGELLALQLKPETLSAAEKKREKALIAEHWDALLGPLAPLLKPASRFARGFLVHAELRAAMNAAVENAIDEAKGHPLWNTVESFSGEGSVLKAGTFPVLRAAETYRIRLSELVRFSTLEALKVTLQGDDLHTLTTPGNFPALHSITLDQAPERLAVFEDWAQQRSWRSLKFTIKPRDLMPYCALVGRPLALATPSFELVVTQSNFAASSMSINQENGKTVVTLEFQVSGRVHEDWVRSLVADATAMLEVVAARPNLEVRLLPGKVPEGPILQPLLARVKALQG
jgi:uncharacterized protein (TIGR02996 family)